jgi:hypothetical protein
MARFYRRGISKIYWKAGTDIAPPAATVTLATGSVDLSDSVAEIAGFTLTSGTIATPDLGSRYTKTIPGEDTTPESSLTFYDDDAGTSAIRTALTKGAIGYITLLPYGKVSGKRAEIWVVQVTGVNDQWTAGNDPARFMVSFAVLEVPNQADTSQT